MKISKYMTDKVITIGADVTVKEAFDLMRIQEVRHLPVMKDDKMVGFISDRDLRRPKWADSVEDWKDYYDLDDETTVGDIMIPNPEVVYTYDTVYKAVKILREQLYGALPVLNKKEELVGILSAYDLLDLLADLLDTMRNKDG